MDLNSLPSEILEKIFSHLPDPLTVSRCEKVCTLWAALVTHLVDRGIINRTTDWGELADLNPTPSYNPIANIAHSPIQYCLRKRIKSEVTTYKEVYVTHHFNTSKRN